jgi:aquaporin NIP
LAVWAPSNAKTCPGTLYHCRLIGNYALVRVDCGAIVVDAQARQFGRLAVALAFGMVVVVTVAATGHLSGAHPNPAVLQ